MTTVNRYVYGWEIEGFGTYAEYNYGGVGVRLSTEPLDGVTVGAALYVVGLADLPKKISTTCEVLKGSTTQSTMQILIDGLDRADQTNRRLSNHALQFFWGARPKAVANLGEPISAATTIFVINLISGETVPAAGDMLYLGREVMAITGVSGSGATRTLTVSRAALATTAEVHELEDTEIFLQNPLKLDRRVTLYEYDVDTDTETARWRGIIEGVDLSDGTQVICVTCRDLLGTLSKRRVAKERWQGNLEMSRISLMTGQSNTTDALFVHNSESYGLVETQPYYPDGVAGDVPGTDYYGTLGVAFKLMCFDVDGIAILGRVDSGAAPIATGYVATYIHRTPYGPCKEISGSTLDIVDKKETRKGKEVLACNADSSACMFQNDSEQPSDHPAIIMLNLLTSTGTSTWPAGGPRVLGDNGGHDWLPGHWGLAIPADWIDVDAFTALTTRYPTQGLRARAGYIGAEDDQSAMDLLADLAQSMNAYIYMTDDARLSINTLRDPGFGGTDHTIGPEDIAWMDNEGDEQGMVEQKPVYAISLECAQRGPGGKPGQIIDAGIIGQKWVRRYRYHAIEDKIDSTRIYGDPVTHTLANDEIERIAAVFRWRYAYTIDRLPQYRMRLVAGSALVMPGQWVNLTHPYFYNNDDLTRGFDVAHRCLVLEGNWEPKDGSQELVVVDISPVTGASTLLSPAWSIESVTSNTVFVLSDTHFEDGSERDNFVAGATYYVDLWTADGQLRSTSAPKYATAYNAGTGQVTLNSAWTAGLGAVTPAVGNVVRLREYDATQAAGWIAQSYTWLGDTSMQVDGSVNNAGRWDV